MDTQIAMKKYLFLAFCGVVLLAWAVIYYQTTFSDAAIFKNFAGYSCRLQLMSLMS